MYKNNDVYVGYWKNDMKSGSQGTLTCTNGDSYDGSWKNDLKHGKGKQKYGNGDSYVGDFE